MLATETDVVIAARSGDRAAIRTIHDTYCGRLYDHCSAVLRDPETAGDVMLETFMLAFVELHRLEDPTKLQSWLFALARDQMLYRPRSPLLPPDRDDTFDPLPARARAIAWEAGAWFPRRERIVLDLHLRQRLRRQDLADAIGASIAHATALSSALEEKLDRLVGALLVARLAPECPELTIFAEHAFDPRVTMRRFAHHVDRCPRCSAARCDLPLPTELIASVPAESEPAELRGEALEGVHVMLRALESSDGKSSADEPAPGLALISDPFEELDDFDDLDENPEDEQYDEVASDEVDYQDAEDDYDVVSELTPPPVPLRKNGFPNALFPERRRMVALVAAVAVGIVALALGFDTRGTGSQGTRLIAAEANETTLPTTPPPTVPSSTAVTAPTAPADTTAPSVTDLATTFACIGPKQPTTDAVATVSDDHTVRSVDLIVTHEVLGSTRKRMSADGGQYRAQIGPFTNDGTITWTVEATDDDGNVGTAEGPPVGSSTVC